MLHLLRREPGFYRRLWTLALPIILQNLITTSLGFVDTFMVGLLGNHELSAVTAANSPIFLLQVIIFGLMSGLTVLASQYWGKGDTAAINRCMGVAMYMGLAITVTAAAVLFAMPETVMRIVTPNETLVELGTPYLRIVGISYIFNSLSSVYASMQRSTENPAFGLKVFAVSMALNTVLNYILIFGHFGAPALGVTGAAVATLTSRIAEFCIAAVYAVCSRRVPLIPSALLRPGKEILYDFSRFAFPVIGNETLWGLGTTMMTVIMGHMSISAEILAAYAIMGNVDKFSTVACFGVAGAASVMVGKYIGEGHSKEETYRLSACLLLLSFLLGVLIGGILAACLPTLFVPYLYPLFHLSGTSLYIATVMCVVFLCVMPFKAFDITNITGVLRAGGDSNMAFIIDIVPLWCVAVPLTALAALVLDAPLAVVCMAIQTESLCKCPWGICRFRSRKWINDVTRGEEK